MKDGDKVTKAGYGDSEDGLFLVKDEDGSRWELNRGDETRTVTPQVENKSAVVNGVRKDWEDIDWDNTVDKDIRGIQVTFSADCFTDEELERFRELAARGVAR